MSADPKKEPVQQCDTPAPTPTHQDVLNRLGQFIAFLKPMQLLHEIFFVWRGRGFKLRVYHDAEDQGAPEEKYWICIDGYHGTCLDSQCDLTVEGAMSQLFGRSRKWILK